MYLQLFRNRDRFVVIDDVDSLYSDRNGIRLLKCLCQTEEEKSVAWHSAARVLKRRGIPREFVTKSRVIIICNDWRTLNRNVAALQDRGHVLVFRPTAEEVHQKASRVVQRRGDPGVVRRTIFIAFPNHRCSSILRAAELKRAGMEWTEILPLTPENTRKRIVMELKADTSYPTEESRVREFISRGGGCRATYFNYVRRLGGNPMR